MPDEAGAKAMPPGGSIVEQRSRYRDALADIWAILYHDGPDTQWSVGMLEDIAAILERTGVIHVNPPHYQHH